MVNLSDIISRLPFIVDIILKIALLLVAIFFGRIVISGWKEKLGFFTRNAGILFLGFVCFVVGLLLPFDFFPSIGFVSEMINTFIVAVVLYIILALLSAKRVPEYLTKKDFAETKKEIDVLRDGIAKIKLALSQKGIDAKPASEEDIRKSIAEAMEKVLEKEKEKDYDILHLKFKEDAWEAKTKVGKKEYIILINKNGEIVSFKKTGLDLEGFARKFREDKLFLAGAIASIIFVVIVFNLFTPMNISKVSDKFSFYGIDFMKKECLTPSALLEQWNSDDGRLAEYNYDMDKITLAINDYSGEDYFVSPFLYDYIIIVENNGAHALFFATKEQITSMPKSLSLLQTSMLSGENLVCSVELETAEVCDCNNLIEPRVNSQIVKTLDEISSQQRQ